MKAKWIFDFTAEGALQSAQALRKDKRFGYRGLLSRFLTKVVLVLCAPSLVVESDLIYGLPSLFCREPEDCGAG